MPLHGEIRQLCRDDGEGENRDKQKMGGSVSLFHPLNTGDFRYDIKKSNIRTNRTHLVHCESPL